MIKKYDKVIVVPKERIFSSGSAPPITINKFFSMANPNKEVILPPTRQDIFVYRETSDNSNSIIWVTDCYVILYDQNMYEILSSSKDAFSYRKILERLDVRNALTGAWGVEKH